MKIVKFIAFIFLSCLSSVVCAESISVYLNYSLAALRMVDSNPRSITNRQNYLDQLNELVKQFHASSHEDDESVAQKSLDRTALIMMDLFNKQAKLGADYDNNLGKDLFNDVNEQSLRSTRVIYFFENRGQANLSVNINDATQLALSNYQLLFDKSSHYVLTRESDNKVVSTDTIHSYPYQIQVDGFVITIRGGRILSNDKFIIAPLNNAASKIQLLINDPKSLALAWPVNALPTHSVSEGSISVTDIVNTTTPAFSIAQQLNPPLTVKFISSTQYVLMNTTTTEAIEGPIAYQDTANQPVFPTPNGYDPGYRITLQGYQHSGNEFTINYNLKSADDNRNGLAMENIYQSFLLQG